MLRKLVGATAFQRDCGEQVRVIVRKAAGIAVLPAERGYRRFSCVIRGVVGCLFQMIFVCIFCVYYSRHQAVAAYF